MPPRPFSFKILRKLRLLFTTSYECHFNGTLCTTLKFLFWKKKEECFPSYCLSLKSNLSLTIDGVVFSHVYGVLNICKYITFLCFIFSCVIPYIPQFLFSLVCIVCVYVCVCVCVCLCASSHTLLCIPCPLRDKIKIP